MTTWAVSVVTPTASGHVAVPSAPGGVTVPTVVIPKSLIPDPMRVAEASGVGATSVVLLRVITRSEAMGVGTPAFASASVLFARGTGSGSASVWASQGSAFSASGSGTTNVVGAPVATVAASGSGSGSASALHNVAATGSGSGAMAVAFRARIAAPASGSGSTSVQAYNPASTFLAQASGSGTTSVTGSQQYAVAAVAFGEGSSLARVTTFARGTGSGTATVTARARVAAPASGAGTTTVAAVSSKTPMGLNKTAVQTIPTNSSTWRKQVSLAVRDGFPGTQLVDDTLVVKGTGRYRCYYLDARNGSHSTNAARLLVNGTEIARSDSGAQNSVVDTTGILNDGDILQFESYASTVGTAPRQINTSTYVELTQA